MKRTATFFVGSLVALVLAVRAAAAQPGDTFVEQIKPLLAAHCLKCHDSKKPSGGVDLSTLDSAEAVLKQHKVTRRVIEQLATESMPPDDEKFTVAQRTTIVDGLKQSLQLLDRGDSALLDPGPSIVRRLSHVEYNNVIRDLLGHDLKIAQKVGLPADSTGSNYENIANALQVPPTLLEKYFAAADVVLDRLFGPHPTAIKSKPEWMPQWEIDKLNKQRATFFAELPEDAHRDTAQKFIARFTRLAWRRPLTADDVTRLMKVYDTALAKGDTPRNATRRTLKPVLISPDFLFRIEEDHTPAAPANGARVSAAKVSDVELASRLSYFLWSSLPDDQLLSLAEQGRLSQPEVLAGEVRRMLLDARAKALTENFFLRWLGANRVTSARPSTEFFPAFNDSLKRAMLTEATMFCDHLRTEDRPVLELLDSDYTFASADLAKHYGLDAVASKDFERVALRPEHHRGGVLGMGAILASTSHTDRTSPTQRGKWMLEVVFGTPPAPPPANASQFKDDKKQAAPKNFREKLAQHATDSTCAGCHRRMDPLGFGLDNFDAVGAWRPTSADLDTSGVLPEGEKFGGVDELKQIVWARRDQFTRNLIGQMLTYALGRELEYYDEMQISQIKTRLDTGGGKFSELIVGIVSSYPFQYRRNAQPLAEAAPQAAP